MSKRERDIEVLKEEIDNIVNQFDVLTSESTRQKLMNLSEKCISIINFSKRQKNSKCGGVVVEVEGGVVTNVDVELECDVCGALVYDKAGYQLIDHDIEHIKEK